KIEQFRKTLEERILECERVLANADVETRANSSRQADAGDQAAAEYERQTLAHKADVVRQTIRSLGDALKRMSQGTFGERDADCALRPEVSGAAREVVTSSCRK